MNSILNLSYRTLPCLHLASPRSLLYRWAYGLERVAEDNGVVVDANASKLMSE